MTKKRRTRNSSLIPLIGQTIVTYTTSSSSDLDTKNGKEKVLSPDKSDQIQEEEDEEEEEEEEEGKKYT